MSMCSPLFATVLPFSSFRSFGLSSLLLKNRQLGNFAHTRLVDSIKDKPLHNKAFMSSIPEVNDPHALHIYHLFPPLVLVFCSIFPRVIWLCGSASQDGLRYWP